MCVVSFNSELVSRMRGGDDTHRGLTKRHFSPVTGCVLTTGWMLVRPVLILCSAFNPCNRSAKMGDSFLYASAVLVKTVSPPISGHSSMYRNTSPGGCECAVLSECQAMEVVRSE